MMRVVPVLTTCLAVFPAMVAASQDTRSDEPGVVVRLYDIGVGVRYIPELAPDQLPNVVKVMDTIELRTDRGDFAPLEDRFIAEVIANIKIEEPGTYRFRLISDDGSRLWIDDKVIIDHDGLHGADPKDGNVELTAGSHTLRILHFESAGGEHLELRWRQPGAADDKYTLISAAALTHDTGVSRETSPGTKRIIPPLRRGRPGDGTPVAGMHPGYDVRIIEPHIAKAALPEWDEEPSDSATRTVRSWRADDPCEQVTVWFRDQDLTQFASGEAASVQGYLGGQWIGGDSDHGTLHRMFLDPAGRTVNVVAFRCASGLGSDVAATFKGKDGARYFSAEPLWREDTSIANVLRLLPNRLTVFEMLGVRAMTDGFEIEFTKALDPRCGWEADSYYIEQWPFSIEATQPRSHAATEEDTAQEAVAHKTEPGASATGQRTEPEARARVSPPRRDGVRYPVKSASVSPDRMKVFLEVENLKESHVVYIRLLPPCVSEDGELPWSTEAWYTLNVIPKDRFGKVLTPPAKEPQNFLTAEEKAAGWELLFGGKTTDGWRGYKKDHFPDQGWKVTDGCIVRVGPGGGDICTVEQFDNFELKLDWRICAAGNSGIFYRVDEQYGWPWESGPEMQVLDNAEHADGRNPKTSAGSNYALHAPVRDVTEPIGFFNKVRIVADGCHIEYWLNGVKIVAYELESPEWEKLVAESKFKDMPHHGRVKKGHIVLQDHGDKVWYRNIKIRRLGGE